MHSNPFDAEICAETGSKIRSFLYQLAEKVTDYRSLHSLTEQVRHQYHGRFAIELIQNAYDAVSRATNLEESPGRIEMRLELNEGFGTLYVANDGAPFSRSNFESISRLGQSDKDPTTSIGNKGIGFRSVLEISQRPKIWSRQTESSLYFDGYCFGFDPEFVKSIHAPVLAILEGRSLSDDQRWFAKIVDEDPGLCARLRAGVHIGQEHGTTSTADWLREEIGYLSPYLLPWPLTVRSAMVEDFENRGFASVVALPLGSATAVSLVESRFAEISAESMLFLDNLKVLTIATPHGSRTFQRCVVRSASGAGKLGKIAIRCADKTRVFSVWQRQMQVSDMPKSVQDTIRNLPGQWPKLEHAEISVAVSDDREPIPGKFSIFLPTVLETGAALHINAPFFGDMSRTAISFDTDEEGAQAGGTYNDYLLHQAAVLALEAISSDLAGRSVAEAANILDILAPNASETAARARWQEHLNRAATDMGVSVEDAPWMLSDQGWRALSETSLLPLPSNPKVLDADVLRQHAAFPAYVAGLDSRKESIENLSDHFDIGIMPEVADQACMIESAARTLVSDPELDWGHFWRDVCDIFDDDLSPLKGREVILCTDGALHPGGVSGRAIYFRPRHAGQDDNGSDETGLDQVPTALRRFIAILDPKIPVSEVRDGRRQNTKLHKLLVDAGLVNTFRREDVLADILVPNLPPMPVAHGTGDAELCRDALFYALRLAASSSARGDGEGLVRAMARVPVPCRGGWYPLSQAIFGRGWEGTHGAVVDRYLQLADSDSARAARDRMLCGPDHPDWGELGETARPLLESAGVFDGLPLVTTDGEEPALTCHVSYHRFQLHSSAPPPIDEETWHEFSEHLRSKESNYKSGHYKINVFNWLPGLENRTSFSDDTKQAFLDVIMGSAPHWGSDWASVTLMRDTGTYEHIPLDSPLLLALARYEWIPEGDENPRRWTRPAGRWNIPSRYTSNGRMWTFEHLAPLPVQMAAQIERNEDLKSLLEKLGVAHYDPEAHTADVRLLQALGNAVKNRTFRNDSTLIGQLRAAWGAFHPSSPAALPSHLVVQRPDGQMDLVEPAADNPVYLPSSRSSISDLRELDLSVVAMEPKDAQRLADDFSARFGAAVRNSERFELVALSGEQPLAGIETVELPTFRDLDGVIPLILTIVAFHGQNAQGTQSTGFNNLLGSFREAQVAVVSELSVVPMISDQAVADPVPQMAAWLAQKRILVLDAEWKSDIQSVADALSRLVARSDLRVQIRAGLNEIWPNDVGMLPEETLKLLDLSSDHYHEVLELWRGDLGPVISRLARLLRVLSREDLARRCETSEQHDHMLMILREALEATELPQKVLDAAVKSRDIIQFGILVRGILGPEVELAQWNQEAIRHGEAAITNPSCDEQFQNHRSRMLPVLRRIVAALAVHTPEAPSYTEMMTRLDDMRPSPDSAQAYWELPALEVAGAIVAELAGAGFELDETTLRDLLASDEPGRAILCIPFEVPQTDPVETASENRRLLESLYSRFMLIAATWHGATDQNEGSAWREAKLGDPTTSPRPEDRDVFTVRWDEARVLEFLRAGLPATAPQKVRDALRDAESLDVLMTALQVDASEMEDAQKRLSAQQVADERKKRMVSVCGEEIENSESGLADLFTHISMHLPDAGVCANDGFDLSVVTLPQKIKKLKKGKNIGRTRRTRAPGKMRRNMEDLIGAAGEIHAFRWLQLRYGKDVVTPANWVSAYSAKAFPDNASCVDEGKGCDIVFTLDGCTYHIEVKSSEDDNNGFTLGSSEIQLAREIAQNRRNRRREKYFVLKVNQALTSEPQFTLLPNPYDPAYKDRFDIVEEGARVTFRP